MSTDETCGQPVQYGRPGGTRVVFRCGHPIERDGLCRSHLQEQEYQRNQFQRMMDNATRHWGSIAVHGKGRICGGCNVMVLDGQEHPWNVPHAQELAWWEAHPDAQHRPSLES